MQSSKTHMLDTIRRWRRDASVDDPSTTAIADEFASDDDATDITPDDSASRVGASAPPRRTWERAPRSAPAPSPPPPASAAKPTKKSSKKTAPAPAPASAPAPAPAPAPVPAKSAGKGGGSDVTVESVLQGMGDDGDFDHYFAK